MHTKKELDSRLAQAKVQPLKKLGQNFLLNPAICTKIVSAVKEFAPKTVIEIGPGLGALTDELLECPTNLILMEIDAGFVRYWEERVGQEQVRVIHADALRYDWDKLEVVPPTVLVSNLPYSIAASIVIEMSVIELDLACMVLMFQKEVAQRIAAPLGDENYAMLSVVAQTYWNITTLIDAGPQDFFPVPNVGSRVLLFTPKEVSHDRQAFLKFVKVAYEQRRKKLCSNLSARYKKPEINAAFEHFGFKDTVRAQELSTESFRLLFEWLEKTIL